MFDDIGSKIKTLAMVVCCIGIIGSVIGAFIGLGFLGSIAGCLVSWISTWMLYAFGQLVENSDEQVRQNKTLYKQNEEMLKQLKKMNDEAEPSKPAAATKSSSVVCNKPETKKDGKPIQWGMKTCKKCGEQYSESRVFCPNCGEMCLNANASNRKLTYYEDYSQQSSKENTEPKITVHADDSWKCLGCGNTNSAAEKFCVHCGLNRDFLENSIQH